VRTSPTRISRRSLTTACGRILAGSTTAYQHETQENKQDLFAVAGYFWNELTVRFTRQPNANRSTNFQLQSETSSNFSEELKLVSPDTGPFTYPRRLFLLRYQSGLFGTRAYCRLQQHRGHADTKTADLYARPPGSHAQHVPGDRTSLHYDDVSYVVNQALYTAFLPLPPCSSKALFPPLQPHLSNGGGRRELAAADRWITPWCISPTHAATHQAPTTSAGVDRPSLLKAARRVHRP